MKRLNLLVIVALVISVFGLAPTPANAVAADWYAAPYGDNGDTCTSWASACQTIGAAVGKATAGGVVHVAEGTYNESQINITQALSLLGAGIGRSIIDGGGGGGLTNAGLIRVAITGSGSVTLQGFTLQTAKAVGTVGDRIYIDTSGATGGTQTFSYLKIIGSGLNTGITGPKEFGFYSHSNAANVMLTHSDVSKTANNAILFEKHSGTSEVAYNTLAAGAFGADAYFNMTHSGLNVTALQTVHHNTFDLGACSDSVAPMCSDSSTRAAAVSFTSAYPGSGAGAFSNVEISDNNINNLKANRRGVILWNGEGGVGNAIANARILRNKIVGVGAAAGSQGITLINQHTGTVIQGNSVTGVERAFWGREYLWPGYTSGFASGTVMNNNAFASSTKVQWDDPVNTLNAEHNWWGCPLGPGNPGCVAAVGLIDYTPWDGALVSTVTGSTHEIGETGTMTTSLTVNGLYGAQLRVTHDPAVLSFSSGATINVPAGGWYWDLIQEAFAAVTAPVGRRLSGSMQLPHATPANLSNDAIATWTYTCSAAGTSNLTYDTTTGGLGTLLSDKDGFEIPSALIGDSITCVAATGSVAGTVQLQGRVQSHTPNGWEDAAITFTCASGGCTGSGPYVFITGVDGAYQLTKSGAGTGMAQGTYNVTAVRHEYLGASKSVVIGPGLTTVSTPKLLGGDADNSGAVGLNDLACIGGAYGAAPTNCGGAGSSDINGDNVVNVFDLVLASGNYTLSSSNPW